MISDTLANFLRDDATIFTSDCVHIRERMSPVKWRAFIEREYEHLNACRPPADPSPARSASPTTGSLPDGPEALVHLRHEVRVGAGAGDVPLDRAHGVANDVAGTDGVVGDADLSAVVDGLGAHAAEGARPSLSHNQQTDEHPADAGRSEK